MLNLCGCFSRTRHPDLHPYRRPDLRPDLHPDHTIHRPICAHDLSSLLLSNRRSVVVLQVRRGERRWMLELCKPLPFACLTVRQLQVIINGMSRRGYSLAPWLRHSNRRSVRIGRPAREQEEIKVRHDKWYRRRKLKAHFPREKCMNKDAAKRITAWIHHFHRTGETADLARHVQYTRRRQRLLRGRQLTIILFDELFAALITFTYKSCPQKSLFKHHTTTTQLILYCEQRLTSRGSDVCNKDLEQCWLQCIALCVCVCVETVAVDSIM